MSRTVRVGFGHHPWGKGTGMDRIQVRFTGFLHICVMVRILPRERTVRIQPGHARMDCAQLSDAELAELVDWGCDHKQFFSARKEDLFAEIHEVWLRRVFHNTSRIQMTEDNAKWAEYLDSLTPTPEPEAIPA